MSFEESQPDILTREDGATIAYRRLGGRTPTIVFLGGFMSDMTGAKAQSLHEFCAARGQAFVRFDYFGHGASSGDFAAATVGRWKDDTLAVIDQLTTGPLVLVGSSMGGWLMLLAALARPARIAALVGIAAAPDATEKLMWPRLTEATRRAIMEQGSVRIPSAYDPAGYLITRVLVEDGVRHSLPASDIPIQCPVRLLQGMVDPDVPWRTSIELAGRLASQDVRVVLIKDGDHRLSRDSDLALLRRSIEPLVD